MRDRLMVKTYSMLCALLFVVSLSGCATTRHAVPEGLIMKAQVEGMDDVRYIQGENNTKLQESLLRSIKQERATDFPLDTNGVKTYSVLAISGGGDKGAYGAGLLKGWSKEGSRPVFKVVTGVSTGAISAPFAFLGKDYDELIETLYTTMSTKDVMKMKGPLAALFGNSIASNGPLAKKIACIGTKEFLDKIAEQHKLGRRLYVGTVNLDAQKFVIWDMGAIACKGDTELFHKVILASAAIPVTFPPTFFRVEADGQTYDEMHVDGGTLAQVFTTYGLLSHMQKAVKELGIDPSKVKAKLYIIRNGYMSSNYVKVKDSLMPIAVRAIDTIIDAQGVGDAYRIYAFMKKRGNDFNLACIPADYKPDAKEMFDPCEMTRLFNRGYEDAVGGYKWHKAPPGMDAFQAAGESPQEVAREKLNDL